MPLFVCDLVLEPGESIVNVAVGDSVRWLIAPASSGAADDATPHVLIKPTEAGLRTYLIVTTIRRTYYLSLVSRKNDPMLRIGFSTRKICSTPSLRPYHRRARPTPRRSAESPETAIDKLDFDYRLSGDRSLQPRARLQRRRRTPICKCRRG